MLNYNKNGLIDTCLDRYYETFSHTLDTADYVPEKYNNKILKYIFKNMKRAFSKLNREDRLYQRAVLKQLKAEARQAEKDIRAYEKAKAEWAKREAKKAKKNVRAMIRSKARTKNNKRNKEIKNNGKEV